MPKKVPRNNPVGGSYRTVQSAAALLQRIKHNAVSAPAPQTAPAAVLEQLRHLLPEELRPHLLEALEKPGELVLFADSAAWAGRIRLAMTEVEKAVSGRKITIRLLPPGGFRK